MSKAVKRGATAFDAEVGARVRLRRAELGLSQGDLAARLGISFQQVQKYERGANRIAASTLQQIAEALNVPMSVLLGEGVSEGDREVFAASLRLSGLALQVGGLLDRLTNQAQRQAIRVLLEAMVDGADPSPAA